MRDYVFYQAIEEWEKQTELLGRTHGKSIPQVEAATWLFGTREGKAQCTWKPPAKTLLLHKSWWRNPPHVPHTEAQMPCEAPPHLHLKAALKWHRSLQPNQAVILQFISCNAETSADRHRSRAAHCREGVLDCRLMMTNNPL